MTTARGIANSPSAGTAARETNVVAAVSARAVFSARSVAASVPKKCASDFESSNPARRLCVVVCLLGEVNRVF